MKFEYLGKRAHVSVRLLGRTLLVERGECVEVSSAEAKLLKRVDGFTPVADPQEDTSGK